MNTMLISMIVVIIAAIVICILKRGKKAFPYMLLPVLIIIADYWFFSDMPKLYYIFLVFSLISLLLKRKHIEYH